MSSIESLSGKAQFERVHATGRRCTRNGVTAIVAPRAEGRPRLGLVVSRATGKAVLRNKIRRRLRQAFRAYGPGSVDAVLIARAGVSKEPYAQVEEYVKECLSQAGAPRAAA